jgi:hypothetical protein
VKAVAKAIVGALVAGLSVLGSALDDGHVSASEIVATLSATLVAFAAVYFTPNARRTP